MPLTANQKKTAKALLAKRPPVYDGTRVVVDRELQVKWFEMVSEAMKITDVKAKDTGAFCDLAGVPD